MEIIGKWNSSVAIIREKRELGNLSNMFCVLEISGWEMFQAHRKERLEANVKAGETEGTQREGYIHRPKSH